MSGSKSPTTGQTTKETIQLEKPEKPQPLNGHHPSGNSSYPKPDHAQQSMLTQLIRKERDLQKLAHLLAARDAELARIKSSRSWRLLGRYWQLKHDYVMPVLRFFGLASPAASGAARTDEQHTQSRNLSPAAAFDIPHQSDAICRVALDALCREL